jgi:CRP/FNR family cyclic AMP-dependent transcriptional regulator
MSDTGLLGTFASHAFLHGLPPRHRMLLASGARPFTAAPGDVLAREGETAKAFYLIQSGHVVLSTRAGGRGSVDVQTVGPGEVVGWSWVVPPHRWQFEARARDAVSGIVFDAAWLREQCEHDHQLGYFLLQHLVTVLAGRLAATRLQSLDRPKT